MYETKKIPREQESLNKLTSSIQNHQTKIPKGTRIIRQKLTKKLTQKKKKKPKGEELLIGWQAKSCRLGGRRRVAESITDGAKD